MKVVDLHPEDLLDKEVRGELTESERARLDAHLERCATCRFEREARDDFALELADGESELSVQRLLAIVRPEEEPPQREAVREDVEEVAKEVRSIPAHRHRRRIGRIAALVAAAVLVGGIATAKGGSQVWAQLTSLWSDTAEVEASTPTRASAPSAVPAVFSSASAIRPERAAPDNVEEAPPPAPTESSMPAPPPPPPVAETAKSLFDAVSEARRQGDYARAIILHRKLQTEYPKSREAHVSHATIGRLLLDRGDAVGALESFDAYQSRGPGALDEAVLVGRATALERLGRADEARAAWQALLATFPETPYAEHARTRMGTSGARAP